MPKGRKTSFIPTVKSENIINKIQEEMKEDYGNVSKGNIINKAIY